MNYVVYVTLPAPTSHRVFRVNGHVLCSSQTCDDYASTRKEEMENPIKLEYIIILLGRYTRIPQLKGKA